MISYRFKYWLFLAVDACFRLKRRLISSEDKDPALGSGWAYYVEDKPFREYIKSVEDQQEASNMFYAILISICLHWADRYLCAVDWPV
jgi:hypothetical protein